jgi:hypothetical protein
VGLDGPALRARRPRRADAHYPLARVARVISVGAVQWHPDALLACLREHKPVAMLDRRGRFVRLLFRPPTSQFGLARHLGELLAVPRFRARYGCWRGEAERAEMQAAAHRLGIPCQDSPFENVWQRICREQHRRWGIRVGGCYRTLLGLAAAHIASAFALIGMPRDPLGWQRQEYRLFCQMLRLERWWQAVSLEEVLARGFGKPGRPELTAAFEAASAAREQRLAVWRQQALLQIMGLKPQREEPARGPQAGEKAGLLEPAAVARLCQPYCGRAGNQWRIPFGPPGSLRTSARIVRTYLEYDRRMYESYRTA